jgi:hypothetical protein
MDTNHTTPEFDADQIRAELFRAAELAASNPASQAACDIMRLVRSEAPAAKVLPARFEPGDAETDGWDRWSVGWDCEGQRFELSLSMYGPFTSEKADGTPGDQIHGDGFLSLEVDDEPVMALRVELRCDDADGRITVVGATEFEPGPWTDVVCELSRRLADGSDPRTGQKAA